MSSRRHLAFVTLLFFATQTSRAQLSKGQSILLNRGLQLQGMAVNYDGFHLATYSNANYTAINWLWDSVPSAHGPPPGFPWSRWVRNLSEMPPLANEGAYTNQLVSLQLGDEANLNDAAVRSNVVSWFNAVRVNWPNTILYVNNFGGQVNDAALADFYSRAQPDMLCFDTYPWRSVHDLNQSNHIGATIAGPPTGWYSDLRRYREHAKGANLPLAAYRQTFHAVQDYDATVYRDPSPSELRLNTFAAFAFNAKVLIDFLYNNGSSSLFIPPGGDSNPNALYAELTDANRRAQNFGKALVRLKPVSDAVPNSYTTGILFLRGKNSASAPNPIPISFLADPEAPNDYTDWAFQRNDPYLTNNWVVTNRGTKNNGQPGDVILAWFQPLDETFDGADFSNEIYLMVVNGLSDPTGSAADCAQEIKLNFINGFIAVESLNPLGGWVQPQALPLTDGFRQLVLNLNGGDAALFKFSDGAPFVGAELRGAPVITAQPINQTNVAGSDAVFSARAAGGSPIYFQWLFNGAPISGATTNRFTRTNAQSADAGDYAMIASNSLGSVTSAPARLTIFFAPQILSQPQGATVAAGSNVLFSIAATGNPAPVFQWRFNGTNIPGATANNFLRTNAQSADAGIYSVVVSNAVSAVASSNASLIVNGPPSITSQPQSKAVVPGNAAAFTVSAVGTGTLFFHWRKDDVELADGGKIFGATTSSLTVSNVQSDDTGNFSVEVSNSYGTILSAPAALEIATPPAIQIQPQSRATNSGNTVTFNVVASGNGLIYQWRRGGTNLVNSEKISGATASVLTLSAVTKPDATSYSVFITNAAGNVTSSPATLTVLYPLPWREPFAYATNENLGGKISPDFLAWADVGTNVAGNFVTIEPGNLGVTNLATARGQSIRFGGVGKSARLSFPNPFANGALYFSFALKVLDLAGATQSGGFIAGFNNSTGAQGNTPTVVGTRVYLRATNGGFHLGVAKNSSTAAEWSWATNLFQTNQTIFVVGSYTFNLVNSADDISKLWLDPAPTSFGAATPPAPTLTAPFGSDVAGNQIASFVFFRRDTAVIPAAMIADELRIATTWAEVTPVTQPVRIDSATISPDGLFQLRGSGDAGNFSIESSSDLAGWNEVTNIFSGNGIFEFAEAVASGEHRYYRVHYSP